MLYFFQIITLRKILSWPHYFTKRGGLAPYLTSNSFLYLLKCQVSSEVNVYLRYRFPTLFKIFLLDFGTVRMVWYIYIYICNLNWLIYRFQFDSWKGRRQGPPKKFPMCIFGNSNTRQNSFLWFKWYLKYLILKAKYWLIGWLFFNLS